MDVSYSLDQFLQLGVWLRCGNTSVAEGVKWRSREHLLWCLSNMSQSSRPIALIWWLFRSPPRWKHWSKISSCLCINTDEPQTDLWTFTGCWARFQDPDYSQERLQPGFCFWPRFLLWKLPTEKVFCQDKSPSVSPFLEGGDEKRVEASTEVCCSQSWVELVLGGWRWPDGQEVVHLLSRASLTHSQEDVGCVAAAALCWSSAGGGGGAGRLRSAPRPLQEGSGSGLRAPELFFRGAPPLSLLQKCGQVWHSGKRAWNTNGHMSPFENFITTSPSVNFKCVLLFSFVFFCIFNSFSHLFALGSVGKIWHDGKFTENKTKLKLT